MAAMTLPLLYGHQPLAPATPPPSVAALRLPPQLATVAPELVAAAACPQPVPQYGPIYGNSVGLGGGFGGDLLPTNMVPGMHAGMNGPFKFFTQTPATFMPQQAPPPAPPPAPAPAPPPAPAPAPQMVAIETQTSLGPHALASYIGSINSLQGVAPGRTTSLATTRQASLEATPLSGPPATIAFPMVAVTGTNVLLPEGAIPAAPVAATAATGAPLESGEAAAAVAMSMQRGGFAIPAQVAVVQSIGPTFGHYPQGALVPDMQMHQEGCGHIPSFEAASSATFAHLVPQAEVAMLPEAQHTQGAATQTMHATSPVQGGDAKESAGRKGGPSKGKQGKKRTSKAAKTSGGHKRCICF